MLYPDDVNYWKELAEKYSNALAEMVEVRDGLLQDLEDARDELSELRDEYDRISADMKEIQHYAKGW